MNKENIIDNANVDWAKRLLIKIIKYQIKAGTTASGENLRLKELITDEEVKSFHRGHVDWVHRVGLDDYNRTVLNYLDSLIHMSVDERRSVLLLVKKEDFI